MCLFRKGQRTLAIIGNGFDLAHGFSTTYETFSKSTSAPSLEFFKSCCDDESSITSWYLFEENIKMLTNNLFLQSYQENCDYDANREKAARLRDAFKDIHNLLIKYLKSETEGKPVTTLRSISRYLRPNTKAINFNYTKIAETYTNDVVYVHGSLDEEDILLGYDYREEPCLSQYEDMCWSKVICRESLAFRRYLKEEMGLEINSPKYKELTFSLESYQQSINMGLEIDIDPETYIPNFHFIDNFMRKYKDSCDIPKIDYKNITTIVILGHGIEADQVYLKKILSKCDKLQKVVIYRYHGETVSEFTKKASFFQPYCKKVCSILYD